MSVQLNDPNMIMSLWDFPQKQ